MFSKTLDFLARPQTAQFLGSAVCGVSTITAAGLTVLIVADHVNANPLVPITSDSNSFTNDINVNIGGSYATQTKLVEGATTKTNYYRYVGEHRRHPGDYLIADVDGCKIWEYTAKQPRNHSDRGFTVSSKGASKLQQESIVQGELRLSKKLGQDVFISGSIDTNSQLGAGLSTRWFNNLVITGGIKKDLYAQASYNLGGISPYVTISRENQYGFASKIGHSTDIFVYTNGNGVYGGGLAINLGGGSNEVVQRPVERLPIVPPVIVPPVIATPQFENPPMTPPVQPETVPDQRFLPGRG